MQRSESVGDLMKSLAAAQLEFAAATKDSKNPFYNSSYADLASVISAVRPALNKHGIAILHDIESDLERQTASVVVYLFKGEEWISMMHEAPAVGKTKDGKERFDVQTIGAVWTYLRRYGTQAITGLASEDDDGNAVVRDDSRPVPSKQQQKRVTPSQVEAESAHGPDQGPDEPPRQTSTVSRSAFFGKAKEYGWTMDALKNLLMEAFKTFDTSKLSQEQLQNALHAMAAGGPDEVLANLDQFVF